MADFDVRLAQMKARLEAALSVVAAHPEVAEKVSVAVAAASPGDVVESQAQDDARANALARALDDAMSKLPVPPAPLPPLLKKTDVDKGRGGVAAVVVEGPEMPVQKRERPRSR